MYLLFAFLFVLLLLSNVIINYTNLFRNRESTFLMSLPVTAQTIFRWKFIESTLLASWAFVFLIVPLLAAYGLTQGVAWHFYPVTVLLLALFVMLPGVAGSWLAVNLARHLDRRAFQVAAVALAVTLLVLARFWWKANEVNDELLETRVPDVLNQLLRKTSFAQFPFLPSYWLSASLLQWAEGALTVAGFFMLVLLSHVMFFGFLAFTRLGGLFPDAASRVSSRASVWGQWEWFRAAARRRDAFLTPTARSKNLPISCAGSAATSARCSSRTPACSGATPPNGASPCCCSACSAFTSSTSASSPPSSPAPTGFTWFPT